MNDLKSFTIICSYLPARIKEALLQISDSDKPLINEIRIRAEKPIVLHFSDRTSFLTEKGCLTEFFDVDHCIIAAKEDVDAIFNSLCRYSVHSCSRELSQGFFTIANGIRVGISGSVSDTEKKIIRYVSGMNFRVSRQIIGCSEKIFNRIYMDSPKSLLICGGVNSGKTTVLRDLCRICGKKYKISLIDERNELSASVSGIPTNDIGVQTDIIEGGDRASGILSAIRTLSPDIIFCDEISGERDSEAVMSGIGCGVKFAATAHAEFIEDLYKRFFLKKLLDCHAFDYIVMLEGASFPGKIREIRRVK